MVNEKLPEERKNRDFVQIYRDHIDDITKLGRNNARAYDLFMCLIKHMDGTNALCVSNNALAEILDTTTRTIQRAVKYLKDNGWVCVLKSGTSNVYIVNPDVAWTSYGNQKQYCKFQTNVLLSSSENAEYLNNPKATTHFKTVDAGFMKSIQEKQKEFENHCKAVKGSNDEIPGQMELEDAI